MSPIIHWFFSLIAVFFSATLILPIESHAVERKSWEGSVILVRESSRSSSRSYKRWLREQRRLARKMEREQAREAKRYARNQYSRGSDYYPAYQDSRNPVVSTDEYYEEGYAPDGTYHSNEVTEDRHESYYSPGRQQAITPPNTTQDTWTYGDGVVKDRQKTTWIGADGQHHSTTINRTTQTDEDGNTHTETHVDLKRQAASSPTPIPTPYPMPTLAEVKAPTPDTSSSSSSSSSPETKPTPKPTEVEEETGSSAPPAVSQ